MQVPLTNTGIQYLESGIRCVESRIQDCLGFPYVGRLFKEQGIFFCHIFEANFITRKSKIYTSEQARDHWNQRIL